MTVGVMSAKIVPEVILRVRAERRHADQPPEIRHLGDDHDQSQSKAQVFIVPALPQTVPKHIDQHDDCDHQKDRQEMGEREIAKLHLVALAEEVSEEFFHDVLLCSKRVSLGFLIPANRSAILYRTFLQNTMKKRTLRHILPPDASVSAPIDASTGGAKATQPASDRFA